MSIYECSITNPKKQLEFYKDLSEQLQRENQQLKEKINQYENPDDLTLFYMWLDEKAKDKMKQLKERTQYLERSIARKEETIDDKQNEIVSLATTIEKIKHILNNQMDYREFVDMINGIEDVLKESDVK